MCTHSKFSDIIFNKYKKLKKCSQCIANQLPKGSKEDKTDQTTNQNSEAAKTKKKYLIATLLEKIVVLIKNQINLIFLNILNKRKNNLCQ